MADDDPNTVGDLGTSESLNVAGYGPAYNEYTHDTLYGPGNNKLYQSNVAISPDEAKRYPMGSGPYKAVDHDTGEVYRTGLGIADWSYKHPGEPNYKTVEFWNDRLADQHSRVDLVREDNWQASGYVKDTGDGAPPLTSPLQRFKERYSGDFPGASDDEIINGMWQKWAPHTDKKAFSDWMQDPDGSAKMQEGMAPIDRLRLQQPEYRSMNDDQLVSGYYNWLVKEKRVNPDVIKLEDVRDQIIPPDWKGAGARFVREVGWQLNLQTQSVFNKARLGIAETEEMAGPDNIKEALSPVYPGQDIGAIAKEYAKLNPQQQRDRLVKDYAPHLNADTPPDKMPLQLLEKLQLGLDQQKKMDAIRDKAHQLRQAIQFEDTARDGYTPEGQLAAAKFLGQLPAFTVMGAVPGVRELGIWGTTMVDNMNTIATQNPGMSQDEIQKRAKAATEMQFPIWEVLSLGLGGEGGMGVRATIANRLNNLGRSAAVGVGAFDASKIIQNIESGRDPREDVRESTLYGIGFGGAGAAAGLLKTLAARGAGALTVKALETAFKMSPEVRNNMNLTGNGHTPEQVNAELNGEPNEIDRTAKDHAISMIQSAAATVDIPEETLDYWEDAWREWHYGNHDAAEKATDKAMAATDPETEKKIRKKLANTVGVVNNKSKKMNDSDEIYMNIRIPSKTPIDTKGEENNPVNQTTVKVGGIAGIGAKEVPIEEIVPEEEGSLIQKETLEERMEKGEPAPSQFSLGASGWIQSIFTGRWYPPKWFEGWTKMVGINNPEMHNGVTAETAGALVKNTTSALKWKYAKMQLEFATKVFGTPHTAMPKDATLEQRMGVFWAWMSDALFAARVQTDFTSMHKREAFWGSHSNAENAFDINKFETHQETGDERKDKLFKYYHMLNDWLYQYEAAHGIEYRYLHDYLMHMAHPSDRHKVAAFQDKWMQQFGDPSFTKTRKLPTYKDMAEAGIKPFSYNLERLMQMRLTLSRRAIGQVDDMGLLERAQVAFSKENSPEQFKKLQNLKNWKQYNTPDGNHYMVMNDAVEVLDRKYDVSSMENTAAAPFWKFAAGIKGASVPFRLSWSLFHQFHIAHIALGDLVASGKKWDIFGEQTGEKITGRDILDALTSGATQYFFPGKYGDLTRVLQGRALPTAAQATDMADFFMMGLSAEPSYERTIAWQQNMSRVMNGLKVSEKGIGFTEEGVGAMDALKFGYNVITAKPYQKLMFEHMIPNAKVMAAMRRRDALIDQYFKKGINLRDDAHRELFAREMQSIGRDVEARYGEIFYDNLLWKAQAKQLGTAIPLSLGWQLGFWRVYGDAIVDTFGARGKTSAMERFGAKVQRRLGQDVPDKGNVLTNRMAYAGIYTATALGFGGIVTYFMTGKPPKDLNDLIFPAIGIGKDGRPVRIRPPFFTTEFGSMGAHWASGVEAYGPVVGTGLAAGKYIQDKLSPGLAAMGQFISNKDFYGREVYDFNSFFTKSNYDNVGRWLLKEALPISVESQWAHENMTTGERIAAFLGFSPAPRWTTRTAIENDILSRYSAKVETQTGKRPMYADLYDAKKAYQEALNSHDMGRINQTRQFLRSLPGSTDRMVKDAERNSHIPPTVRMFGQLDPDIEVHLLHSMNQDEFKLYYPHAKKEAKHQWDRERSGLGANQVPVGP